MQCQICSVLLICMTVFAGIQICPVCLDLQYFVDMPECFCMYTGLQYSVDMHEFICLHTQHMYKALLADHCLQLLG